MELTLNRREYNDHSTIGDLFVDGVLECLTLEDKVRDLGPDGSGKVYGGTAIPAGRYRVIEDFSEKFQKTMLHVLDVPWFTGIRIHSGNTDHDTLGCILVGKEEDNGDFIHGGSVELPTLQAKIHDAIARGEECWITVNDKAA